MPVLLLLVSLVAAASAVQTGRFPPGAIVDPQLYDRPHLDHREHDAPPNPLGLRHDPYLRDQGPPGRPPFDDDNSQFNRLPYGPTPPPRPYYEPSQSSQRPYFDSSSQRPYFDSSSQRPGFDSPQRPYEPQRPHRRPPPPTYAGQGAYPQGGYPQGGYPQGGYPQRPQSGFSPESLLNPLGGLSNALSDIARYDDKKCVARILCEMTAGGRPGSGYYRGSGGFFDLSNLSGLSGVMDLIGAMTSGPAANPMLVFGRAALLGATMRDPYRCYRSFPECPRDPDRLVDYLNNHNGGFFRLFDPAQAQNNNRYPSSSSSGGRPPYYTRTSKQLESHNRVRFDDSQHRTANTLEEPKASS